jgi:hypothetical protein
VQNTDLKPVAYLYEQQIMWQSHLI